MLASERGWATKPASGMRTGGRVDQAVNKGGFDRAGGRAWTRTRVGALWPGASGARERGMLPVGALGDLRRLVGELPDGPLVLDADVEGAEGPAGGVEGGVDGLGEEGRDGAHAVLGHVGAGEADEGAGLRKDGGAVHDEGAAAEGDAGGEEEVEVEEAARHAVDDVEAAVERCIERGGDVRGGRGALDLSAGDHMQQIT